MSRKSCRPCPPFAPAADRRRCSGNLLGPRIQLFHGRPHAERGKAQAAAVSGEDPLEAVVEQLAQGLLLLGPRVPGHAAPHLQATLPGPEVVAGEEVLVVPAARSFRAYVLGGGSLAAPAPARGRHRAAPPPRSPHRRGG